MQPMDGQSLLLGIAKLHISTAVKLVLRVQLFVAAAVTERGLPQTLEMSRFRRCVRAVVFVQTKN